MIGGQVGIVGHIKIADEVKIAAQSGIGNSIEEKGSYCSRALHQSQLEIIKDHT